MESMIEIPWPPSVNSVYRMFVSGRSPRMIISKAGRAYFKEINSMMLDNRWKKFEDRRLKIEILAFPPDKRRRDLDNLGKVALDALQKCGVYEDDSQIDELLFIRAKVEKGGHLRITIEEV